MPDGSIKLSSGVPTPYFVESKSLDEPASPSQDLSDVAQIDTMCYSR